MAIIPCRNRTTRSKVLLVLAAISFISLALAVPHLISVYRQDRSPLIQSFTAELTTTTSEPEEGANRPANYEMPAEIRDAFKGLVPENVVNPDGGNIHFSVRTSARSYANRFPVVFLTWFQVAPPHNVSRFQDFKVNERLRSHVFLHEIS